MGKETKNKGPGRKKPTDNDTDVIKTENRRNRTQRSASKHTKHKARTQAMTKETDTITSTQKRNKKTKKRRHKHDTQKNKRKRLSAEIKNQNGKDMYIMEKRKSPPTHTIRDEGQVGNGCRLKGVARALVVIQSFRNKGGGRFARRRSFNPRRNSSTKAGS